VAGGVVPTATSQAYRPFSRRTHAGKDTPAIKQLHPRGTGANWKADGIGPQQTTWPASTFCQTMRIQVRRSGGGWFYNGTRY
jgi:hypothetical protein